MATLQHSDTACQHHSIATLHVNTIASIASDTTCQHYSIAGDTAFQH